MLEDFFKVLPSHMKVPPDHYKGPQATSKGHTPWLIPVAAMRKCKQTNGFQPRHYGHPTLLIIHEWNLPDFRFNRSSKIPSSVPMRHSSTITDSMDAARWLSFKPTFHRPKNACSYAVTQFYSRMYIHKCYHANLK